MKGATELHKAAKEGDVQDVQRLIEGRADLKAYAFLGERYNGTPLHCAASGGHAAVARMLLDGGADAAAKRSNVSPRRAGRGGAWGGERGRTGALTACAGARARMSGRAVARHCTWLRRAGTRRWRGCCSTPAPTLLPKPVL